MAGGIHASSPGSATLNHQMGHSVLPPDYTVHSRSVLENGVSLNDASNSLDLNTVEGSTSRKRKHSVDATNHLLDSKRTCIYNQLLSDMIIEKEKYLYFWLLKEYSSHHETDFFRFVNKIDFPDPFFPFPSSSQPKSIYFSSEPETFQKLIPADIISALKTVKIVWQESNESVGSTKNVSIVAPARLSTTPAKPPPCSASTSNENNSQHIAEKAKQEAQILQRIAELQKLGLWTEKRLPKVQESPRAKAHWDYVLEELEWLAADFAQERKWKKAAARKRSRMIQKHFQEREAMVQKNARAAEVHIRKIASHLAKMMKSFWSNVEKLVEFKHQTKLKEKRQQALDQHLSFIVDKTEKYSSLVAESMNKSAILENSRSHSPVSDVEFEPNQSSSDDEETIEAEEKGNSAASIDHTKEIEMLKRESQLPLEDLLSQLPEGYLKNVNMTSPRDQAVSEHVDDDDEYEVEGDDSDDETTLLEEEKIQNIVDYKSEIAELESDNNLSIEELRKKYNVFDPNAIGYLTLSYSDSSMESELDDTENSSKGSTDNDDDDDDERIDDEDESDDLRSLLRDSTLENGDINAENTDEKIDNVAAIAESIQPRGNTLSSTSVVTKVPFLLKHTLREYQHIGLDWLVTMYESKLNGILADEMGLGKTIQTIALLAHLASDKESWGPHLIIVPTSVMLNWEMEFKKWFPAFKIMTYYGNPKERKLKRSGWTKPNTFHVCITSYKLVLQDHHCFRRKKWQYLILDEAQNIKNFKSQRWQRLLNFDSERRLLLTGTPLQNNLMELWSLMHFLMPNLFSSHREFKEWFSNPVTGMIEGNAEYNENIIKRLHKVLRPFLLRRLKSEVEKQLPSKHEHIIMCRLSNRQRFLYDDFMSRAKTKETLSSGSLLSVVNVLMQLRKVCNHPNLFEPRPVISPFQMENIVYHTSSLVYSTLDYDPFRHANLTALNLRLLDLENEMTAWHAYRLKKCKVPTAVIEEIDELPCEPPPLPKAKLNMQVKTPSHLNAISVDNNVKNNHKISLFLKSASTPKTDNTIRSAVYADAPIKPGPIYRTILGLGEMNHITLKRVDAPVHTTPNRGSYSFPFKTKQKFTVFTKCPVKNSPLESDNVMMQPVGLNDSITTSGIASTSRSGTPACGYPVTQKLTNRLQQLVQTSTGKHVIVTPSQTSGSGSATIESGHKIFLNKPYTSNSSVTSGGSLMRLSNSSLQTSVVNSQTDGNYSKSEPSTIVVNNYAISSISIPKPISSPTSLPTNSTMSITTNTSTRNKSEKVKYDLPEAAEIIKRRKQMRKEQLKILADVNDRKSKPCVIFGCDVRDTLKILDSNNQCPVDNNHYWRCVGHVNCINALYAKHVQNLCSTLTNALVNSVKSIEERIQELSETFSRYIVYIPAVNARKPVMHVSHPNPSKVWSLSYMECMLEKDLAPRSTSLHQIVSRMSTAFPDGRLMQYDCGKLQRLDELLKKLKFEQHRVLIFTQMARMLDVLEAFLTFHGHIYLRLDGSTRIDQRQVLMETFNNDKRYFCFILSTRSGGIGVNLIGADTVIFYDSDWNPTMDAQAQDRCHRIGQTRDVNIYRLISEKTIEENILKKANQKKLLGDLAIEGGNFTAAYFKSTTIHDLFNVDVNEADPAKRMCDVTIDSNNSLNIEKSALNAYENALAAAEDEPDVAAARTAKEEAVADLAEFDENIPLTENDGNDHSPLQTEECSKAEQEVNALIEQLTPIERWALLFMETVDGEWAEEQLAAAEAEIEQQKKEWELERLAIEKADVSSKRFDEDVEEDDVPLTYSSEDANNQNWVSLDFSDFMPIWLPFSTLLLPSGNEEIYIDRSLRYLYETFTISEHLLPPIYYRKEKKQQRTNQFVSDLVPKNSSHIRVRNRHRENMSQATISVASLEPPKSLFDRPTPIITKLRQDMRLQKYRGLSRSAISNAHGMKPYFSPKGVTEPDFVPEWLIHEDYALLQCVQHVQELPLNLSIMYPGHTVNWDLVSELVNQVSIIYRSPMQCKNRFMVAILPREEGMLTADPVSKKQKKLKGMNQLLSHSKYTRNYKTAQLYFQDGNNTFTQMMNGRFDTITVVSNRRAPTIRRLPLNTSTRNTINAPILSECEINYDRPLTPVEIATKRALRLAKEKQTQMASAEQQLRQNNAQQQQQQLVRQQQMQQQQQIQLQQPVIMQQIRQIQPQIASHKTIPISSVNIVPQQMAVVVNISQSTGIPSASPVTIRNIVHRPPNEVIVSAPPQQSTSIIIPQSKSNTSNTSNLISTNIQRLIPITQISTATVSGGSRILTTGSKGTPPLQLYKHQQSVPQHQLKIIHPGTKTPMVGVVPTSLVVNSSQQVRQQMSPQLQQQQRPISMTTSTGTRLSEAELAVFLKKQQLPQQKIATAAIATTNANTVQTQIIATQAGFVQTKNATEVALPSIKSTMIGTSNLKSSQNATNQSIRQITIQPQVAPRKLQKVVTPVMLNTSAGQNISHVLTSKGSPGTVTSTSFARVIPVNKQMVQLVNATALRAGTMPNVTIDPTGTRYIPQIVQPNTIKLSGTSTVSMSTLSPQQSLTQLVQNQALVRQGNLKIQSTGIVSTTVASTSTAASSLLSQVVNMTANQSQMSASAKNAP